MSTVFNKPFLTGNETKYIEQAVKSFKISGNGMFTKKCHAFFQQRYGFQKCLLTTSCTDALEMCAMLLHLEHGDEIIVPSYTFVSTANAFVINGAKIVFCDSLPHHPNIDPAQIEALITSKTRAIVVVHYAGVACDMDVIMAIAQKHNLIVIEDAAQAIDGFYKGKALGGIGHLATFSFHETKNIISGEGGMLVINDEQFEDRAEILWEKGTNRNAFFRGDVDKYNWVDIGSSFLPSDIIAAFLYAQLENIDLIQTKRVALYNMYQQGLSGLIGNENVILPTIPSYSNNNAHMFYLHCKNEAIRNGLIDHLRALDICAVFHYLPLHKSPFMTNLESNQSNNTLVNAESFSAGIVRLPFYYELGLDAVAVICEHVLAYFKNHQ